MKNTTLDINGPILSFTQQPFSTSILSGTSTSFVAIATATFPTQNPLNLASNTGILSYRWYSEGVGALSNGSFRGATISGTTTPTLTVSNAISPTTTGSKFYVEVDYTPSAYVQPVGSTVTAGTARSTGNAVNDVLVSNQGVLTIFPTILIETQPKDAIVFENESTSFSVVAKLSDDSQANFTYQWSLNNVNLVDSTTISGSTTANLTIFYPFIGTYSIQVKITHSTPSVFSTSSVFSTIAKFNVVAIPLEITTEVITSSSTSASIQTQDLLLNNELTLLAQNFTDSSTLISLFAKTKDINIEMDIYGGKGSDFGSNVGGNGGYSKIRFLMKKNEEYVIAGLDATNNCPFIYRKGSLIAVIGKGGNAVSGGNGGNGGGINNSGASGGGRGGGSGGLSFSSGTLTSTSNGILGSSSTLTPISPDTKATIPNAGRTLPCTKGNYWISRGFSPCSDVGVSKFYSTSGSVISNTAEIQRGYKAGYSIIQTGGGGVAATTETVLVSRTCTRTIPRTSYRTVSRAVTKTTTFTHNNSISASGDPMVATTSGTGYSVNVSGLGLNSTNYSVGISNISQTTNTGTSASISLATGPTISGNNFSLGFNSTITTTATRRVQRTSYRTVSRAVTKTTTFTHFFDNTPGVFQTTSFTSSGDPMTATINGALPGVTRSYSINVSGLGLNSTTYSVGVTNTDQAAAGDFPGISVNSIVQSGYNIYLEFKNNTNNATTFARNFTVTVTGTQNFEEAYDDSYDETYNVTTTQSSFVRSFTATVTGTQNFEESYDDSYQESYNCDYYEVINIAGGGNGGSGATGGNGGGNTGGGGGGSGYTDGSVTVVSTQQGGSTGNAKIIIRKV